MSKMLFILPFVVFIITLHCNAKWVEVNNVIYDDGVEGESGSTEWTFQSGRNCLSNEYMLQDNFTFTSACCQSDTKYFDGVTNVP